MATHDSLDRASQDVEGERYRSTPLRPAVWMTSVLVWATIVALILRVPTWAGIFLCTLTGVSFLWFLVCYVYLFVSDREVLRAERWRGRPVPTSSHAALLQRPSDDPQRYLAPQRTEFAVPETDRVGVGTVDQVIER